MTTIMPKYNELLLPALRAVSDLGGSGSIPEIVASVIRSGGFTDEQQEVLHNNGPETEIGYRIAWARTYLKYFGFVTNSARGVWAITDEGARFLSDPALTDVQRDRHLQELKAAQIKKAAAERAARGTRPGEENEDSDESEDEGSPSAEVERKIGWKERLIASLKSATFSPAQFERLAQRLLREAGFESVTVTGGPGDQGIDGVGIYRLGLLTFPVFFQCKRYKDSVGPGEVRDFRGAMQGRGEKGLLITTGTFTAAAKSEANRDSATPIDLIDGDRLCDLLQQYELGVSTTVKQVAQVDIVGEFFTDL